MTGLPTAVPVGSVRSAGWLQRLDRRLWAPAPAVRLALFRVLTGVFAVGYMLVRLPVFLAMADTDAADFEGIGVLWWLHDPIGSAWIRVLVLATLALGVVYTFGAAFRIVGPLFAGGLLLMTTYRSSAGQLLWFENLAVLHVLIVGWARSADALTPSSWVRHHRVGGFPPQPHASQDLRPRDDQGHRHEDDARYGWPLRLAAVVTVTTYFLAGLAKLRMSGIAWMDGESLRNHVAFSAARLRLLGGTPSPVAGVLVDHVWVFTPAAVATMVIELGAPLALLWKRVLWPWVVATWMMHAAIAATMFVVFPYPLTLVAFAPLFALERLRPRAAQPRSTSERLG